MVKWIYKSTILDGKAHYIVDNEGLCNIKYNRYEKLYHLIIGRYFVRCKTLDGAKLMTEKYFQSEIDEFQKILDS